MQVSHFIPQISLLLTVTHLLYIIQTGIKRSPSNIRTEVCPVLVSSLPDQDHIQMSTITSALRLGGVFSLALPTSSILHDMHSHHAGSHMCFHKLSIVHSPRKCITQKEKVQRGMISPALSLQHTQGKE